MEKNELNKNDILMNGAVDTDYNLLMSAMQVSVSKHLLDDDFTMIWGNDFYYDLIGYPKEEYEALFHNKPDLYFKGYDEAWIAKRMKGIQDRKQLTDVWKDGGITESKEYVILTNEIYKEWSGMSAKEYKEYKGLRKESLRDNMSDIEVTLADLGEIATREIAKKNKPQGLKENIKVAREGGSVAKNARVDLEKKIGESVITKNNALNYEYKEENLLENK